MFFQRVSDNILDLHSVKSEKCSSFEEVSFHRDPDNNLQLDWRIENAEIINLKENSSGHILAIKIQRSQLRSAKWWS